MMMHKNGGYGCGNPIVDNQYLGKFNSCKNYVLNLGRNI